MTTHHIITLTLATATVTSLAGFAAMRIIDRRVCSFAELTGVDQ